MWIITRYSYGIKREILIKAINILLLILLIKAIKLIVTIKEQSTHVKYSTIFIWS